MALNPELQSGAQEIIQKWKGFLGKVNGRIGAVVQEAEAGLDALIAQHATDHAPMGAAFSALQARFHGLTDKIDDAWEKIEEQWEELTDDVSGDEYEALNELWTTGLYRPYRAAMDGSDMTYATLEMQKNADWARRLQQLAQAEAQKPAPCSQCGAPFQLEVYWQASQANCPSCGSLVDMHPGMAAGLFYQGLGVHALSHEGAFAEWKAEQEAEKKYKAFSHPAEEDLQEYIQAGRNYYTAYYQHVQKLNPGFDGNIEGAVDAKLTHYTAWDQPVEQQKRAFITKLVAAAASGDAAAVKAAMAGKPHHVDLDECAEATAERHDTKGTLIVLNIKYDEEGEDDPRQEWLAENLKDVIDTVKRRAD